MSPSGPIRVTGKDGLSGTIQAESRRVKQKGDVALVLDGGQQVLVPADLLEKREDGTYYLPLSPADLQGTGREDSAIVLPLVEEQLRVRKRRVVAGRTRVHKIVREREALVDEPLLHEDVEVQRVPINRAIDAPVPVRQEGDTLIVPLIEEVLVVQKRLVLREEVRITRRRTEVREQQTVTLRSEDVIVDHLDGAKRHDEAPHSR